MKIALVDTGHANFRSVERALIAASSLLPQSTSSGVQVVRTHDADVIATCDKIVVPGQGGFGDCVSGLNARGLGQVIAERVAAGVSYLGICLGLQALFESSREAPGVAGLALLPGRCEKLQVAPDVKIPHMGWNRLQLQHGGHPVLQAAGGNDAWVYFVHSYHAVPDDPSVIKAVVTHGSQQVTAAVARDNVVATQFHPEKSQAVGLLLLGAFLRQ
jgi:imidazole glycerol-phosphate synthase subunit HisH